MKKYFLIALLLVCSSLSFSQVVGTAVHGDTTWHGYLQISPATLGEATTMPSNTKMLIYDALDNTVLDGISLVNNGISNSGTSIKWYSNSQVVSAIFNRGNTLVFQTGAGALADRLLIGNTGSIFFQGTGGANQFLKQTSANGALTSAVIVDSLSKGYEYTSISAGDSDFVYRVDKSGLTVSTIYIQVQGGTSATVNVGRVRSTTAADLVNANTVVNASSFTTDWTSLSTLQNTSLSIGDRVYVTVRAVSGTPTKVSFQINMTRTVL